MENHISPRGNSLWTSLWRHVPETMDIAIVLKTTEDYLWVTQRDKYRETQRHREIDRILCIPVSLEVPIAKDDFELVILLHLPSECWAYRCVTLSLIYGVLGINLQAYVSGKHSQTDLCSQLWNFFKIIKVKKGYVIKTHYCHSWWLFIHMLLKI